MRRLLLLAAGVLAIGASSAHATTIDVTVADDAIADDGRCSLREAVRSANLDAAPFNTPGECAAGNLADTINVPAGTFKLTIPGADEQALSGDLDVLAGLTINGAGAASTIIDGNRIDRVLDVKSGVSVTLQSLTITGGKAADSAAGGDDLHGGDGNGLSATGGDAFHADDGGGIRSLGGLTIIDCAITGNEAGSGGRGGNAEAPFGATASSGQRGGNATGGRGGAGGRGGGIFSQGSLTLVRVRVEGNKAGDGGNGGSATSGQGGGGITNSGGDGGNAFGGPAGNPGDSGGIHQVGSALLTIQDSVIAGNAAGNGGKGGDAHGHDGGVGFTFGGAGGIGDGGDGSAGGEAGALLADNASISRTLFSGNHAGNGGAGGAGVAGKGGVLTNSPGTAGQGGEGNGGSGADGGDGGALWSFGTATIRSVTFDGNSSGAGGGAGAGTGGKGGAAVSGGTPGNGGNGTGGDGGGGGDGGAIHAHGPLVVVNATITDNGLGASKSGGIGSAGAAGGIGGTAGSGTNGASHVSAADGAIARETDTASVSFTIFAGNSSPACHTGITSDTNISLADPSCVGANADPLLGPLADNGGPTLTRRPGDGSPAIDSGPAQGCPETDQRGAVRPSGAACDIGAYERAAPIPVITQAVATVAGTVNPNARASTAHFEYGTTNAYGTSTPDIAVPAGVEAVPVGADLTGLAPSTTYHVRLVATNADGTNASSDASFTTGAQGGGGGGADTTKPVILSASVKPKTFRRRRGTTFRYKLSEAAKVVFTIQRKKGKRYVRATRLSKSSKAGANKRRFKTRKLKPGRYRATLVATDASGNRSKAKRLTFRIKR